jgi:hypothetical protein
MILWSGLSLELTLDESLDEPSSCASMSRLLGAPFNKMPSKLVREFSSSAPTPEQSRLPPMPLEDASELFVELLLLLLL